MRRCLYNYNRAKCSDIALGYNDLSLYHNMNLKGVTPVSFLYSSFGPYFGELFVKSSKRYAFKAVETRKDLYTNSFIYVNRNVYRVLVIDIDRHVEDKVFSISYYQENELPVPNCIVCTDRGVQLFYFLEDGIPRRHRKADRGIRYFRDVLTKLNIAFGGDAHMNKSGACRNPFCLFNPTYFLHRRSFSLDELNLSAVRISAVSREDIRRNNSVRGFARFDESRFTLGNRNSYLFRHLLFYKSLRFYNKINNTWQATSSSIYAHLLEYAESVNNSTATPLPYSELRQICKSVSRPHYLWVSALKNYGVLNKYLKQYNVNTLKERQSIGAYYTNRVRKQKTRAKIVDVYKDLARRTLPTVGMISRLTGLHRTTIWRYRQLLVSLLFWTFKTVGLFYENAVHLRIDTVQWFINHIYHIVGRTKQTIPDILLPKQLENSQEGAVYGL